MRLFLSKSSSILILVLSLCLLPVVASASIIFIPDFSRFTNGQATPMNYTNGDGVTATFSSPDGTFIVAPSFFTNVNGAALMDFGLQFYTLNIAFSDVLPTSFKANFALDNAGGTGTMFLHAYLAGNSVGTTSALATMTGISTGYPEGQISYTNPGGFDKLVFTSNIGDYAFGWDTNGTGNFGNPGTNAVPEPSTYALLCISLGVVGYARKRMNKAKSV
jgi:hypothetical protein